MKQVYQFTEIVAAQAGDAIAGRKNVFKNTFKVGISQCAMWSSTSAGYNFIEHCRRLHPPCFKNYLLFYDKFLLTFAYTNAIMQSTKLSEVNYVKENFSQNDCGQS